MRQPPDHRPSSSLSNETKLTILLVFMGLGILLLITLVVLLLGGRLQLPAAQTVSTATPASLLQAEPGIPTLFLPTVDCGPPTLVLGATIFQVQDLTPGPDGSLTAPPDASDVAYRVDGTGLQDVFVLSPTAENLALLTSLGEGTLATVTRSNCNSTTYNLTAPRQDSLNTASRPDPSLEGITVFFQTDPSGAGLAFQGELAEEVISVPGTPMPDESGVLAEIGLMDVASDGDTLRLTVSVYNFGSESFTLAGGNVSLTPPGAAPLEMLRSDPRLPEPVQPGETKSFTFTFPRPSTPTAVLRVFTVEYDVEGY